MTLISNHEVAAIKVNLHSNENVQQQQLQLQLLQLHGRCLGFWGPNRSKDQKQHTLNKASELTKFVAFESLVQKRSEIPISNRKCVVGEEIR